MTPQSSEEKAVPLRVESDADYVLEEQIGFRLRKAHQRASEIFAGVMAGHDVTPTQFAALHKIAELEPVSQNALGRATAMDPATISGVIRRLKARGFVSPARNPGDARQVRLSLTADGRVALRRMTGDAAEVSRRTLQGLNADEAAVLLSLLDRLGAGPEDQA
ncbi:MAG: MarR family transcriptional regulator [Pseudomonadota bacterium]